MKPCSWCLVLRPEIYVIQESSKLATKRFHKIIKDWVFFYILTLYLFCLLMQLQKRPQKEKKTTTTTLNNQTARALS